MYPFVTLLLLHPYTSCISTLLRALRDGMTLRRKANQREASLSFPVHFTSQNMASSTQTTTTTTQQWILNKYSRSRTAPDPPVKRQKFTEIKDKNASKQAGKQDFDHLLVKQESIKVL